MSTMLIKAATIVNEGQRLEGDIYIKDGRIAQIGGTINRPADREINAEGLHVLPGVIDDQVHFREPGLTHKAEIYTEAKAAVAGGTTSYMEMPNVKPPTLTQDLLEKKYQRGAARSLANYSFFMGTSHDNLEEILKTDPKTVCGIKVFMGSSTGDMLVDDEHVLRKLFREAPVLIATHCEDEATIRQNSEEFRYKYGEEVPMRFHPDIRSPDACFKSSSLAIELANEFKTRLHILHISSAMEIPLFKASLARTQKHITSEVCVHHLWFDDEDYENLGTQIKSNPAIKTPADRKALLDGLRDGHLDIIATDHAPHTREEKNNTYFNSPSGIPLVQHSLNMMLEFYFQGFLTLEQIVDKMAHAPADVFRIKERGYLREGYWADLVLVNLNKPWQVRKNNLLYKCGWSPLEGKHFRSQVIHTIVSGHLAFSRDEDGAHFNEDKMGSRVLFDR